MKNSFFQSERNGRLDSIHNKLINDIKKDKLKISKEDVIQYLKIQSQQMHYFFFKF